MHIHAVDSVRQIQAMELERAVQAEPMQAESLLGKRKADVLSSYEPKEHVSRSVVQNLLAAGQSLSVRSDASLLDAQKALSSGNFYEIDNYNCPCGQKFKDIQDLREHVLELHKIDGDYRCPQCALELISLSYFIKHIDKHRIAQDYACKWPECIVRAKSLDAIRRHFKEQHLGKQRGHFQAKSRALFNKRKECPKPKEQYKSYDTTWTWHQESGMLTGSSIVGSAPEPLRLDAQEPQVMVDTKPIEYLTESDSEEPAERSS